MPEEKSVAKKETGITVTEDEKKLEFVYGLVLDWLNTEMGNRITQNNSFALMHKVSEATGMAVPRFINKQEEPK